MSKKIVYLFAILFGGISVFLFNVLLIERLIIPDICYYHSHDTNFVFDVFYSFPPAEGGHPITSDFSMILSFAIGGFFGFYLIREKMRKY